MSHRAQDYQSHWICLQTPVQALTRGHNTWKHLKCCLHLCGFSTVLRQRRSADTICFHLLNVMYNNSFALNALTAVKICFYLCLLTVGSGGTFCQLHLSRKQHQVATLHLITGWYPPRLFPWKSWFNPARRSCTAFARMELMIFTTGTMTWSNSITFAHIACWWMSAAQKLRGSTLQCAVNPEWQISCLHSWNKTLFPTLRENSVFLVLYWCRYLLRSWLLPISHHHWLIKLDSSGTVWLTSNLQIIICVRRGWDSFCRMIKFDYASFQIYVGFINPLASYLKRGCKLQIACEQCVGDPWLRETTFI